MPRVNECHCSLAPVPHRASSAASEPAPASTSTHGPTAFSVILGVEERLAIGSREKPYLTVCVCVCACVCVCEYAYMQGGGRRKHRTSFRV